MSRLIHATLAALVAAVVLAVPALTAWIATDKATAR